MVVLAVIPPDLLTLEQPSDHSTGSLVLALMLWKSPGIMNKTVEDQRRSSRRIRLEPYTRTGEI